ncbi:hypothetical protein FGADI_1325 [Fusarium gaditjirri]|uniref:Uncharacterized protein n=1 Tax=Fusarium gaditjirri TaxID=282569 RepID=A0A8H4X2R7_9HYPO|nr:hypothetical protein FGADI_1325 [Fusarium gaditjirri]
MKDPNSIKAPGDAQCPPTQSNPLKDSPGRPHRDQLIAEDTPLGTSVGASENEAESPGSIPAPSSASKTAESIKASPLACEPQEGSTTNADAPLSPLHPSTIRGAMTPKPGSADGNVDLEGPSSVSSSVLTTPYASLKRKMQEELYDPISKKMKPASQVSLEMDSFSTEVAGRYLSVVHNEVFRMAGRAGLTNPADFDVGSDGVVGLSKHALKKVYPDNKS